MRDRGVTAFACLLAAVVLSAVPGLWGQEPPATPAASPASNSGRSLIVGHAFTAMKYARRVRVLPDDRLRFVRNERYPTRIGRDKEGRLMMQIIHTNDLPAACDRPDLQVPPVCPGWGAFVIDPVEHTVAHWVEGEIAGKAVADFPLTEARLEEVAGDTSSLPDVKPDCSEDDGEVTEADLGDKTLEGIRVHGVRSTLRYEATQDGRPVYRLRIHEVWTSEEMQLIVRVIDGDPKGEETVWDFEDVSLDPDPSLFRPPDAYQPPNGYGTHHNRTDFGTAEDFEALQSWFAK
jgi:hypothetical protein